VEVLALNSIVIVESAVSGKAVRTATGGIESF
jgi:hypothetical protein